jgi:hypothetical protein
MNGPFEPCSERHVFRAEAYRSTDEPIRPVDVLLFDAILSYNDKAPIGEPMSLSITLCFVMLAVVVAGATVVIRNRRSR